MPADPPAKGTRRTLRIGPYEVEASMTLGSLGPAHRATDVNTGATVALKVLPAELAGNAATRDRFRREAERAARVRSANVVRVLDFGQASGTWYLAMEPVEGESLAQYVQRRGALEGGASRGVLVQAARALSLLHREGLVPRDLSPANFRVTRGPDAEGRITVKLLDIGLLRPTGDDATGDVRTAVASLGPTVWLLLTGRAGGKPDLGALAGDVPDEVRRVLRRLLAQRPEERYQTPAALLAALGEEEPENADEPPDEIASAAPLVEEDALAALSAGEDEEPPPRKRAAKKPVRRRGEEAEDDEDEPPPPPRRRHDEDDEDDEPEPVRSRPGQRKALVWGAVAFAAVLLLGATAVIVIMSLSEDRPQEGEPVRPIRPSPAPQVGPIQTGKAAAPPGTGKATPREK